MRFRVYPRNWASQIKGSIGSSRPLAQDVDDAARGPRVGPQYNLHYRWLFIYFLQQLISSVPIDEISSTQPTSNQPALTFTNQSNQSHQSPKHDFITHKNLRKKNKNRDVTLKKTYTWPSDNSPHALLQKLTRVPSHKRKAETDKLLINQKYGFIHCIRQHDFTKYKNNYDQNFPLTKPFGKNHSVEVQS